MESLVKTLRWAKWVVLGAMIVVATVLVAVRPEASSVVGRIFGYYFQAVFAFTAISIGITFVYGGRVVESMITNYPHEFKQFFWYGFGPTKARRIFKWATNCSDDDRLKNCGRRGLFWFWCTMSIFITIPVGMVVFLILI